MSKILIIADHDGVALNGATAKAVACAANIDGAEIDIAVFAESAAGIAAEAAALDSVTRVKSVENAANKNLIAAVTWMSDRYCQANKLTKEPAHATLNYPGNSVFAFFTNFRLCTRQ